MSTLTLILAGTIGIFIMTWMALAVSKFIYLRNAHWDLCRQIYKTYSDANSSDANSSDADFQENILRYVQIKKIAEKMK